MITQTLKLNLIPGQVLPRVNVSQYDAGTRTLQMLLYNGDQAFNIPTGYGGFVQGTKPDRTGFQYAATVTEGSNVVTLVVTQQMAAVSGEVTCELVIANGDDRIATVNFIIYVEAAALVDDTVISETELPLIEQAAELAQRIDGIAADVEADADRAEQAADNAELWASRNPYIGQNGNWFVFDTTTETYVDTQISATGPQGQTGPTGPQGPQGDAATIAVGTVTTLPAGSQATVINSGTSEAAVFNFGIPKGQDGSGSGDMAKADYDANGAVETAGGIASYVSSAISGKANTSDLGTAAYKDSTTSVTSGSSDLVTSGAVYTALQNIPTGSGEVTVTLSNVSSSKLSFTSADDPEIANITANHVLTGYWVFSNPSAQGNDWDIITATNSIVIQGTVNGTTNLTLRFIKKG